MLAFVHFPMLECLASLANSLFLLRHRYFKRRGRNFGLPQWRWWRCIDYDIFCNPLLHSPYYTPHVWKKKERSKLKLGKYMNRAKNKNNNQAHKIDKSQQDKRKRKR